MATSITSEVVGKVAIPAGASPDGAQAVGRRYAAHVSRPFQDTAPEIQELVRTVLALYDHAPFSTDAAHKILSRFVYNASWDTPFFFMNGTDRIRVMAKGLGMSCWRVASTPRLVTVSMINDHLGRIDVEGTIEFFPRLLFPLTLVAPESLTVHVSWSIVARGVDDRILSVTETLHNVPKPPYTLRALVSTVMSTAMLTVF